MFYPYSAKIENGILANGELPDHSQKQPQDARRAKMDLAPDWPISSGTWRAPRSLFALVWQILGRSVPNTKSSGAKATLLEGQDNNRHYQERVELLDWTLPELASQLS